MQPAPTPLLDAPAPPTRAAKISWSSWRLLPRRVWGALLAVLLLTLAPLALALAGEQAALEGPWTRLLLLSTSGLTLALLATLARLLLLQAEREACTPAWHERETRELERRVESRTRQLAGLATRQQEVSEAEKADLARKLHDELGGLLTAAKMDLSWLQARIDEPQLRERLLQLAGVLDEAMGLKRHVVEELRPSLLDHFGLPTALSAYVEAVCAKAGLARQLSLPADAALPRGTALALFRVTQEALSNTLRHSGAQRITLALELDARSCELQFSDDGCGFDPARCAHGHGILGMQHRIRSLGGQLELSSCAGHGTTVRARVPL